MKRAVRRMLDWMSADLSFMLDFLQKLGQIT